MKTISSNVKLVMCAPCVWLVSALGQANGISRPSKWDLQASVRNVCIRITVYRVSSGSTDPPSGLGLPFLLARAVMDIPVVQQKQKKIIFALPTFETGGPQKRVVKCLSRWTDAKQSVTSFPPGFSQSCSLSKRVDHRKELSNVINVGQMLNNQLLLFYQVLTKLFTFETGGSQKRVIKCLSRWTNAQQSVSCKKKYRTNGLQLLRRWRAPCGGETPQSAPQRTPLINWSQDFVLFRNLHKDFGCLSFCEYSSKVSCTFNVAM